MMRAFSIVSLWDLMQLVQVNELLSLIRSVLGYASMCGTMPASPQREACGEHLQEHYELLRAQCEQLGLDVAAAQIEAAIRVYELHSDAANKMAERSANMIASTIETQLKLKLFFFIPSENRKFYSDKALFGDPVETAFPSASPEIAEAGKCYALGRSSAAVFHLMRALETGIHCLGREFSVNSQHANWQNVLDQIGSNVNAMNSQTHGPNWKDDQQFFSEAVAHFHVLKNGWRNYAMHLHERYDPERAMDIYNSVRAFMRHLSKRLKE